MKKSLLLSLALTLCGGATFADATWRISNDTVFFSKGDNGIMPENAPWQEKITTSKVTHIVLEEGVISISSSAFRGLSTLQKVSLPSSLTTIQVRAFMDCPKLQDIVLPENLTTLGLYAFNNCPNLKNVYFKGLTPPKNYEGKSFQDDNFHTREDINIYAPINVLGSYRYSMNETILPMITKPKGNNIHTKNLRTFSDSQIIYDLKSFVVLKENGTTEPTNNIKAYYASASDDNNITLNETNGILAKLKGIIFSIDGKEDDFYPLKRTNSAGNITGNLLVGTGQNEKTASSNYWGLYSDTEFRRYSGGKIPAYKAYIESSSNAKFFSLNIIFSDEATDINTVGIISLDNRNETYNLSGQKVASNYEGIVIKNGRKYIQK